MEIFDNELPVEFHFSEEYIQECSISPEMVPQNLNACFPKVILNVIPLLLEKVNEGWWLLEVPKPLQDTYWVLAQIGDLDVADNVHRIDQLFVYWMQYLEVLDWSGPPLYLPMNNGMNVLSIPPE